MTDIKDNSNKYLNELEFLPFNAAINCLIDQVDINREIAKTLIVQACRKKKLKYRPIAGFPGSGTVINSNSPEFIYADHLICDHIEINRESFMIWVDEMNDNDNRKTSIVDPCLDKKHPYHAQELKIAIEAWNDLFSDTSQIINMKKGFKARIKSWLADKYPNISSNAHDRISTLINPNPKGGAPKSY